MEPALSCRQRALKELDERLNKTTSQPQMWPSMDEAGSSQDEQELLSPPTSSHQSSVPPPPEMVVVENVPSGTGEPGGGESVPPNSATQPPVKTDPAT